MSGTHTYANSGQDAVTVTFVPGSATASAHSTASVARSALGSPASQGGISSASDLVWKDPANGDSGLFASLPSFATLDAGGFDRGIDALLFRDDRVGELGSWAASNGITTKSPTAHGSSTDYRTVR